MTIELTPRSSSVVMGTIVDFSGKVYGGPAPVVAITIDGQEASLNSAGEFVFSEIYDEGSHVIVYEATNVLGSVSTTWEQIDVVDVLEGAMTSVSATSVAVGDTFVVGCHSENGLEDVPLDALTYTWAPYDLAIPGDNLGEIRARRPGLLTVTCIRGSDSDSEPPQVLLVPAEPESVRTHSSGQSWIAVTAGTSIAVGCERTDAFDGSNVTPDPGYPIVVEPSFEANLVAGRSVEFTRAGSYEVRCVEPGADDIEPLHVTVYPGSLDLLRAEARGVGSVVGVGSIVELSILREDEFGNEIEGETSVVWEVSRINTGGWPVTATTSYDPDADVEMVWLPNGTQGALGFSGIRPRVVFRVPGDYVLRPIGYPIGSPTVNSDPVEIPVIDMPENFGVPNCIEPVNASAQHFAEGDEFDFRHILLANDVNTMNVNVAVNGVDLDRAPTTTILAGEYRVSDELYADPLGSYYVVEGVGVARFGANAIEIDYEHGAGATARLSRMLCTFESAEEYSGVNMRSNYSMAASVGERGLQDLDSSSLNSVRDLLRNYAELELVAALEAAIADADSRKQKLSSVSVGASIDVVFEAGGLGLMGAITLHDIEFQLRVKKLGIWLTFDVSIESVTVRISLGLTRETGLDGIVVEPGPISWGTIDVDPFSLVGAGLLEWIAILISDEDSLVRRGITDALQEFREEAGHELEDLIESLTPYVFESSVSITPVERIALAGGSVAESALAPFEIGYGVFVDDLHFGDDDLSIHAWGGIEPASHSSPDVVDVTGGGLVYPIDHSSVDLDADAAASAGATVTIVNQALHSLWMAGMLAHVELTGEDVFAIFGEDGTSALDVPLGGAISSSGAATLLTYAFGGCISDPLVWDEGDPYNPANDFYLDVDDNPVLKGRVVAEAIERCTSGEVSFPLPPQIESMDEDANIVVALPELAIRIAAHPNLQGVLSLAGLDAAAVYSLRIGAVVTADVDSSDGFLGIESVAVEHLFLGSDDWTSLEVLLDLAGVTAGGITSSSGFEDLAVRLSNLVVSAAHSALHAATVPLPRVEIEANVNEPASAFRGVLSMQLDAIRGATTDDRVVVEGDFEFVPWE